MNLDNLKNIDLKNIDIKELFQKFKESEYLKDKKFLTAWNGLMIGALARGAEILEEPKFLEVSKKAALFIKEHLLLKSS